MLKKLIPLNRLIVFFISCSYLILAFEIFTKHFKHLSHNPITWTPIIFGTTAGLSGFLITFMFNRISYNLFCILMIISIGVGTLGLYLHNRWRFHVIIDSLFYGKPFNFEILTIYTPLLAPSSFIAMGVLGILIAVYEKW